MPETTRFAVQLQRFSLRPSLLCSVLSTMLGCAGAAPMTATAHTEPPPEVSEQVVPSEGLRVHLVDIVNGAALVHGAPSIVTLLSMNDEGVGSRCVGEVHDGAIAGCSGEEALVAIEGDVAATIVVSERKGVPSIDVDSAMLGGFVGASPTFSITSGASPDGLCPAAPTHVSFFATDERANPTGTVVVDASIPREQGSLVQALVITPTDQLVLLAWGTDSRQVVSLTGEVLAEGHVRPALADCDCCD